MMAQLADYFRGSKSLKIGRGQKRAKNMRGPNYFAKSGKFLKSAATGNLMAL
jgi:hypothetical protein